MKSKLTLCSLACLLMCGVAAAEDSWEWIGPEWSSPACLVVDNTGVVYIGSLYMGIRFTGDDGENWSDYPDPADPTCLATGASGTVLCNDLWSPGIHRTPDHGASWEWIFGGLPDTPVSWIEVHPFNGHIFVTIEEYGIYRSIDDGLTWNPTAGAPTGWLTTEIAGDPAGPLYAVSDDGTFRSDDDGDSWTLLTTLQGSLGVAPDGTVFLGSSTVHRSTDGGASWEETPLDLSCTADQINCFTFSDQAEQVFAGSWGCTVARSDDNGDLWVEISDGLSGVGIEDLASGSDGKVYAAGYDGAYLRNADDVAVEEGQPLAGLRLGQNYPNPFNPTTTITYALAETGPVTLRVFDLTGRRVATLVDGVCVRGTHRVDFNAEGLASGAYLYRIDMGGESRTRRFVLIK